MDINDLPIEIFFDILLKIGGKSVGACRRVCRQWKTIIDSSEYLWERTCYNDFPYASRIAKEKSHSSCKWHHIYKNLCMWNLKNFINKWEIKHKELEFPFVEFMHNLNVDIRSIKYRNLKYANNEYALILFYNRSLGIIRPVDREDYKAERYFPAMGFSLYKDKVYFYQDKSVYVCDLLSPDLESKCVHNSEYDIKVIKHFDKKTCLFTTCGNIVTISQNKIVIAPFERPSQWKDQISHICAIYEKNYMYYFRHLLFNIHREKFSHLFYLDIKQVSALFFYEENVLIVNVEGQIWLYRPRDQKIASGPMTRLPEGQYAVQLDVFERRAGTVIIATTSSKIFLLEIDFFPEQKKDELPLVIKRMQMYKKVLENRIILKSQNMGVFHTATI